MTARILFTQNICFRFSSLIWFKRNIYIYHIWGYGVHTIVSLLQAIETLNKCRIRMKMSPTTIIITASAAVVGGDGGRGGNGGNIICAKIHLRFFPG